jgi:hypothetical protein
MDNRRNRTSGRAGESRWSPGTGKPYQNRIKTGTIFEDLLPSEKKAESRTPYQNRIKTPSVEAVELAD